MNPATLQQQANVAQAQGQARQRALDTQARQAQGQYGQTFNQANQAYGNLLNYTKNLQSGQDLYNQQLNQAQNQYGFNPGDLLKANQAIARTQTTLANLPQAIQQQGNYYGTTAGSEAANYGAQAGNLNAVEQGQANAANAFQQTLAATQNQANQAAALGLQSQQLGSQNYQALYSQANQQAATAAQNMQAIEGMAQQQGYLTAEQTAQYWNSYNGYVSANAAAKQASAALISANASAQLQNLEYQQLQKLFASPQQAQKLSVLLQNTSNPQDKVSSILSLLGGGGMGLQGNSSVLQGTTPRLQ